jgi:hypothetical protein
MVPLNDAGEGPRADQGRRAGTERGPALQRYYTDRACDCVGRRDKTRGDDGLARTGLGPPWMDSGTN